MLQHKDIAFTNISEVDFDEDAVFIINNRYLEEPAIVEKCEVVTSVGSYAVLVNKSGRTMQNWNKFK